MNHEYETKNKNKTKIHHRFVFQPKNKKIYHVSYRWWIWTCFLEPLTVQGIPCKPWGQSFLDMVLHPCSLSRKSQEPQPQSSSAVKCSFGRIGLVANPLFALCISQHISSQSIVLFNFPFFSLSFNLVYIFKLTWKLGQLHRICFRWHSHRRCPAMNACWF